VKRLLRVVGAVLLGLAAGGAIAANGFWNSYTGVCGTAEQFAASYCEGETYSYDWGQDGGTTLVFHSTCAVSGGHALVSTWVSPDYSGMPTAAAPGVDDRTLTMAACNLDSEVGGGAGSGQNITANLVVPPFMNLSEQDGIQLSGAILGVWVIAWASKVLYRAMSGSTSGESLD
jgi:hypothetical protein